MEKSWKKHALLCFSWKQHALGASCASGFHFPTLSKNRTLVQPALRNWYFQLWIRCLIRNRLDERVLEHFFHGIKICFQSKIALKNIWCFNAFCANPLWIQHFPSLILLLKTLLFDPMIDLLTVKLNLWFDYFLKTQLTIPSKLINLWFLT